MKYAPPARQTGAVGQTVTRLAFEQLGWGPVPVEQHDTGTDFYVQVRDDNLGELGLLLGVQVKNEKGYFEQSYDGVDGGTGWSYYVKNQNDARYWLTHSVPHIVVLYNDDSNVAYWVHVSLESLQWTEKGAKIWIPEFQRIDIDSKDALRAVAALSRPAPQWAGTSWRGLDVAEPEQMLRTSLLAPRLIAPHPNTTPDTLSAFQAIATLMLCRFQKIDHLHEAGHLEENSMVGWDWDLYSGLSEYLRSGDSSTVQGLIKLADQPERLVAATLLLATFKAEAGRYHEALNLARSISSDGISRIDRSWLQVHEARYLIELGEAEASVEAALDAAAVGSIYRSEPTALVIAAAAFSCTFSAKGLDSEHFVEMVTSNDVAPMWWNQQQLASGYTELFSQAFETWTTGAHYNSSSTHFSEYWSSFRSAVLLAGTAAHYSSWRSSVSRLAKAELMANLSAAETQTALNDLRISGDAKGVSAATRRLISLGQVDAVVGVTAPVSLIRSGLTAVESNLSLVNAACDVVDDTTVRRFVAEITGCLSENRYPQGQPHLLPQRMQREYVKLLRHYAYRLIPAELSSVTAWLSNLPPTSDWVLGQELQALVENIAVESWSPQELDLIRRRVDEGQLKKSTLESTKTADVSRFGDCGPLETAWFWLLSSRDDQGVHRRLIESIELGNRDAIVALGRYDNLTNAGARALATTLSDDIESIIKDAEEGRESFGSLDVPLTLLGLNQTFPHMASWRPLMRIVGSKVSDHMLMHFLQTASRADLRVRVIAELLRLLEERSSRPRGSEFFDHGRGREVVEESILIFRGPGQGEPVIADWLSRGPRARAAVGYAIGRWRSERHVPMLTPLSVDPDPDVVGAAAGSAMRLAIDCGYDVPCIAVVERILKRTGTRSALAVVRELDRSACDRFPSVVELLGRSRSAAVRRRLAELTGGG